MPKPSELAIIFDLDGTLIDSSGGILSSLAHAFAANGVTPLSVLGQSVIGPALPDMIRSVTHLRDVNSINCVIDSFVAHYDNDGLCSARPYPGIEAMLKQLASAGFELYVATNKRCKPTQRIVHMLRWSHFFSGVYSLDSVASSFGGKADLINYVTKTHGLSNPIYVGDRDEDTVAAMQASVAFAGVGWGYGAQQLRPPHKEPTQAKTLVTQWFQTPKALGTWLGQLA